MKKIFALFLALFVPLFLHAKASATRVTDDAGLSLSLPYPAQRVVSLSPHLTELLFAVGAGGQVVGAVDYSDFPGAALRLPRVGSYAQLDLERIAGLRPDLILAWQSGNPPAQVEALKKLSLPVFVNEPRQMENIAATLERIGSLTGHEIEGKHAAAGFRARLAALRSRYAGKKPVSVFYEVWNQPLMTVSDSHLIGQVMQVCAARNVFGGLSGLTPSVALESVIMADPEVIIASGMDTARPEWLDDWKRWPTLRAVRGGHLYFVPPDLLHRQSARILDGAEQFCRHVDRARR